MCELRGYQVHRLSVSENEDTDIEPHHEQPGDPVSTNGSPNSSKSNVIETSWRTRPARIGSHARRSRITLDKTANLTEAQANNGIEQGNAPRPGTGEELAVGEQHVSVQQVVVLPAMATLALPSAEPHARQIALMERVVE